MNCKRIALALLLLSSAAVAGDKPLIVPPVDELEILDPGVDSEGKPRVVIELTPDGRHQTVSVPPAVIVHKYDYTGDRTFQGPLLRGGPTIVVFNHPKTGEKRYVEVQMLPGAPRITYTRKYIEYNFNGKAVRLNVDRHGILGHKGPTVRYHKGKTKDDIERDEGKVNKPISEKIRDAGLAILAPIAGLFGQELQTVEETAQRERDIAVQQAETLPEGLEGTIPTVR